MPYLRACCFLVLLLARPSQAAPVVPDPGHPTAPASALFSLAVDGQAVPVKSEVIDGRALDVAKVSVGGAVNVEVSFASAINTHVVRPIGYDITPTRRGDRALSFTLPGPRNLVVTINNRSLFLFATPLETNVPAAGGPDVMHFGPGIHEPGVIRPKTGQTIYLAPGALVKGRIEGRGVQRVAIRGRGILDGSVHTSREQRTMVIEFVDSAQLVVEGIGIRGANWWQTLFLKSQDIDIAWMNLMGTKVNNDGIDVDGAARVRISHSFVMAGDDCFGWHALDAAANGEPDTEDVTATDCVLWNTTAGNAVRIGASMETQRFRNVTIDRCHVLNLAGYAVFSDHSDWATVSNLTISNLSVDAAGMGLIGMFIAPTRYSNATYRPGRIEGVRFSNVVSRVRDHKIVLAGRDADHQIRDVTFDRVTRAGVLLSGPNDPGYSANAFVSQVKFGGVAVDAAQPDARGDAGRPADANRPADAGSPAENDAAAGPAPDAAAASDRPRVAPMPEEVPPPAPKPRGSGCALGGGEVGALSWLGPLWLLGGRLARRRS